MRLSSAKPTTQKIFPAYSPAARLREPDRHETDDSDERACQHGSSGMTPCVSGGPDAVPPFLHLDHHDLDGDDRVINQEAQGPGSERRA